MKNPLTFEAFVDWLGRKPKDEPYDFIDCHNCAIAQYIQELGIQSSRGASSSGWWDDENRSFRPLVPGRFVLSAQPQTFGAAAERAKAFCSKGD